MRTVNCKGLERPWSVITFGCWQIAPSGGWGDVCTAQEADSALKAALDGGITAFDTAEGYGDGESERRLGQALGSKKDDVLVISKIWPDAELTLKSYRERLDGTLRALARDYVDVYLVHWPGSYFDSPERSARMTEIMMTLRESGKVRAIGLSNFKAPDLQRLGPQLSQFAVNQIPYNLLHREYEGPELELCRKSGVGYMVYSPSARGLLAGRFDESARNFPTRRNYHVFQEPLLSHSIQMYETVSTIAQELETLPVNVAIAWVLAQDNITTAVVGSRKADQVKEFVQAGELILGTEHLERLQSASDAFHKLA